MALPPTSTKGSTDANPVTTFEIDFPNNTVTHTGVKASVGTLAIAGGGTGQVTKAPAFDALSPMTTGGDIIYGGASGTGTRLANGSSGQVLTSSGSTAAPTWAAVAAGNLIVSSVQTSTYSILGTDNVVLTDASGGSFTVTLPTAVGVAGKEYIIKRIDQTIPNAVTIATTSSQTIDGVTTAHLATQYETITIVSDGSNWQMLDRKIQSVWTSFTMTINGSGSNPTKGTTVLDEARWRRIGDSIEIIYNYSQTGAGSAGTGVYLFVLPGSLTIDTSKLSTNINGDVRCGSGEIASATHMSATNANTTPCFVVPYNSTSLAMSAQSIAGGGTAILSTSQFIGQSFFDLSGNPIHYVFSATVPIVGWEG